MLEDRNGKTYSFDVCSNCKRVCCQDANPPLTATRKEIIAKHLKEQGISVTRLFVNEEYSHLATDESGFCQLYDKETRKCRVHSVKPETCCAGPVTFDINLKTGKVEFYLKKAEICGFAGILFENKTILDKHLAEAKEAILQLIQMLDAGSLRAILRIPEPQTFKVGENELPQEVTKKLVIS